MTVLTGFPAAPSPADSETSSSADLASLDDADRIGTRLIHVGAHPDAITGAVIPGISLSTTFAQTSPGVPIGRASRLAPSSLSS
jgi:cystathionine gamma-lyase